MWSMWIMLTHTNKVQISFERLEINTDSKIILAHFFLFFIHSIQTLHVQMTFSMIKFYLSLNSQANSLHGFRMVLQQK